MFIDAYQRLNHSINSSLEAMNTYTIIKSLSIRNSQVYINNSENAL